MPSTRANILFICPPFEVPVLNGGGQRTVLLYRALSTFCSVTPVVVSSVILDDTRQKGIKNRLGQDVRFLKSGPDGAGLASQLESVSGHMRFDDHDAVVFRHFKTYQMCGCPAHRTMILDTDDLPWHASYSSRVMSLRTRISSRLQKLRAFAAFLRTRSRFQLSFVAKEEDIRWTGGSGVVLPNIPWQMPSSALSAPRPDASSILAVASWKWQPNVDGMIWFLRKCWPIVRKAHPRASLVLAGDMAAGTAGEWAAVPGVSILGRVDDLAEHYANATFTIAPIFAGGGTNIKVLESMAYQRTCVATPHAMRGHASVLRHKESLLVAATARQFSAAVMTLLSDRKLSQSLAEQGRRIVVQHYSRDAFTRICTDAVSAVMGRPARGTVC